MKKIKRYSIMILAIGILLATLSFPSYSVPSSSTPHSQIIILGNAELDAFCAGNGTDGLSWETAHVIENYEIVASSQAAFDIEATDRYLIIRNCNFRCTILHWENLWIDYCENINITDCVISGEGGGHGKGCVVIWNSINISLCDSNIRDAIIGVNIEEMSTDITVTRNTFSTSSFGINLASDNCTISYNSGNTTGSYGIYLDGESENNEVFNNCFEGGENFLGIVNDPGDNNIHDNGCRPSIPGYSLGIIIASVVGITTVLIAVAKKKSKK